MINNTDFWSVFILGAECKLNVKQLKTLLWRYGTGLKQREIARLIGRTPQAVTMQLQTIRRKIKRKARGRIAWLDLRTTL